MNSYKLEDIEKLAADTGMRTKIYCDCVHIFLGDFRISIFKKIFKVAPLYELLYTFTDVTKHEYYSDVGYITTTTPVNGKRFYGNLHTVYENMSKKYKELLKTIKTAEIKNCGDEFEI